MMDFPFSPTKMGLNPVSIGGLKSNRVKKQDTVATGILRGSASTKFPAVTGLPAIRGINYVSHR
jgi:hypothetical protein